MKLVPLAIQQKQIVVTCNYEARRRVCLPCSQQPFLPYFLRPTAQYGPAKRTSPGSPPYSDAVSPLTLLQGLYKLQLISEAKKLCPDLVIVLGEDISRFRDKSKELYAFFRSFSWNPRCERLGFDEVCSYLLLALVPVSNISAVIFYIFGSTFLVIIRILHSVSAMSKQSLSPDFELRCGPGFLGRFRHDRVQSLCPQFQ